MSAHLAKAAALLLGALVLTLPFGAWRARTRRLGRAWFLAVHLPVPLIFLLRWMMELPVPYIVVSLLGTVGGQLLGGRIFRPESPSQRRSSR